MVVVSFICMMMSEMNVTLDDTVGIAVHSLPNLLNYPQYYRIVDVVRDD